MKKFVLLAALLLAATSCSVINRAQVETTPDRKSAKTLPMWQLTQNAVYAALQENGNADELVEVSYYVSAKRGFFSRRVTSISVTGYPAYYVEFRETSSMDLNNVETLSRSKMLRNSQVKSIELHTAE